MKKKGIQFAVVSRKQSQDNLTYEQLDESILYDHHVIINTTPMGMYPEIDSFPNIPYDLIGSKHYLYDLIYNPEMTVFLQKGKVRGATIENGKDMLVIQAEESWKIWNA